MHPSPSMQPSCPSPSSPKVPFHLSIWKLCPVAISQLVLDGRKWHYLSGHLPPVHPSVKVKPFEGKEASYQQLLLHGPRPSSSLGREKELDI